MSGKMDVFQSDADRLAEEFLMVGYIWDPIEGKCHEAEDMHPELLRHLRAEALGRGDFTLRYWRGDFYEWQAGSYCRLSDDEMNTRITAFLKHRNGQARTYSDYAEQYVNITCPRIKNIRQCIAATEGVHIPEARPLNTWDDSAEKKGIRTIAFNNGLLMTNEADYKPDFISHRPGYFTLNKLPYDYDPQADCPGWRDFLANVMEGDHERIRLLSQWAGYLLSPTSKRQRFLLIAGEGGNGKTVFTTLLEKMVGVENVSHIPLSQFSNRFALTPTLGKVLNSTSESSHGLDELAETMLKSFTSGDRMTFDRKFREPVHEVPTAKIMISTNQLPQFADKSDGIWRRMLFVPFERSYPEELQNPDLAKELSAELPGIFNWAYEGLQTLRRAGRFEVPKKCERARRQYRRDVNPARAFLLDNYVAGPEYEGLPSSEVYGCYVRFCKTNGYRPMNHANLGKEVKRALPGVSIAQSRYNGRRVRIYTKIAVRDGSEITDYDFQALAEL